MPSLVHIGDMAMLRLCKGHYYRGTLGGLSVVAQLTRNTGTRRWRTMVFQADIPNTRTKVYHGDSLEESLGGAIHAATGPGKRFHEMVNLRGGLYGGEHFRDSIKYTYRLGGRRLTLSERVQVRRLPYWTPTHPLFGRWRRGVRIPGDCVALRTVLCASNSTSRIQLEINTTCFVVHAYQGSVRCSSSTGRTAEEALAWLPRVNTGRTQEVFHSLSMPESV